MTNQEVLDVLINGKDQYELLICGNTEVGMCWAIECGIRVLNRSRTHTKLSFSDYKKSCPEFGRSFFAGTRQIHSYWWKREDTDSRIKAFDILINLYEQKVNKDKL